MAIHARLADDWTPNWATHPGEHLAEYIEVRGFSQAEFARQAGLSPKLVSTIVTGRNPVTPETAIKLERVLGVKAHVWTNLQANWDLFQARAEEQSAPETKSWVSQFPVKELKERGWLADTRDEGRLMDGLLRLFEVGSPAGYTAKVQELAVQHRQSKAYHSSEHHIVTWLMLGEKKAREMQLPPHNAQRFKQSLTEIRSLTVEPPEVFEPRMKDLCQHAGVALIFEKPIKKTCLFGSARWFDHGRALIQMSLRMKSNDHFWWTFFHEAGHILLHRGRNFADDQNGEGDGAEGEADRWAEEILVGRDRFDWFKALQPRSKAQVRHFAREIGIHPGIVVGMLQHAGIVSFRNMNDLKVRFEWAEEDRNVQPDELGC